MHHWLPLVAVEVVERDLSLISPEVADVAAAAGDVADDVATLPTVAAEAADAGRWWLLCWAYTPIGLAKMEERAAR